MTGILSVYKEDSIENAAMYAATALRSCINGIEAFTQDAEFELDD